MGNGVKIKSKTWKIAPVGTAKPNIQNQQEAMSV